MTILDHRILIPKSPEKIWEFLSDLSQNSAWQVDCQSVSILTSKHSGSGVRWRYTTNAGHSYVAEITAWYDGLGYEYTYVDGTPFRESKGRIRLQEIAEGTVVQWTLTYETTGVLGGVRNAVGLKRQFEGAMVDSLKNLWKVLQKVMPEDKPREVKSLMRDAPDYESRTQYRPRHPSLKLEQDDSLSVPSSNLNIVEPPISLEDTRPRAPVKVEPSGETASQQPTTPVSYAKPVDDPDTGTIEPVVYPLPKEKSSEPGLDDSQPEVKTIESDTIPAAQRATQEIKPVVVKPTEAPDPSANQPDEHPVESEQALALVEKHESITPNFDTVKMATGEMSVFDLFGIPRPSQTQEIQPVIIPEPPKTIPSAPTAKPVRVGLRLVLRRKLVTLRRPT